MAPITNGYPSSPAGPSAHSRSSSRKEPFAHIDDLTSVAVDLDPHTPLRKVLEIGEARMRQSITFSDFRRPDLALQEYITAFTIAVDKIPKHKDYPSLKNDRGDLIRRYNALKVKITTNGERFDRIKADIKEDNQRSGVRSVKVTSETLLSSLPSVPSTFPQRSENNGSNGSNAQRPINGTTANTSQKSKPAVHPKPQALHGNTINSTSNPVAQDLTSRFAKLRGPQDASNRAATSAPPKPLGPRHMSDTSRPQPTINSAVPTMPKLPDAIYSPARGTITSEVADLPSSTPRGMFSRTNSIASVGSSSARNSMEMGARPAAVEQFVTAHTFGYGSTPTPPSPRVRIPGGEIITPPQLQGYMQKGASVVRLLLIDVRSREEFDEGHIMSQATLCIEPSVLIRGNISAEDIEESLGIAPDDEMQAFQNRAQYDLVVFYDQNCTLLPQRPSQDEQDNALYFLYQALTKLNYGRELRNAPKLLAGGVDAWVDIFGLQNLQESHTSAVVKDGKSRPRRPKEFASGLDSRRRYRAQTRTLKPEEVKQFEEVIQKDQTAARSPQDFVRSKEEFLRRFPSANEIGESMSSYGPVKQNGFEPDLPPIPPSRPAPAVPRTSYSGLSTRDSSPGVALAKAGQTVSSARSRPTGLVNPKSNCYANSAIQVILSSPGFAAELTNKDWPLSWSPDAQTSAAGKNPQLMARILGNLLQWLAGRQFDIMHPTTLLRYARSIHTGYVSMAVPGTTLHFGDDHQHDAPEFLEFIYAELGRETNRKLSTPFVNYNNFEDHAVMDTKTRESKTSDFVIQSWGMYCLRHDSVIDAYWTILRLNRTVCRTCSCTNWNFEATPLLELHFPDNKNSPTTLTQLLTYGLNSTGLTHLEEGFDCGKEMGDAMKHQKKDQTVKLGRLPPLLFVRILRTTQDGKAKIGRRVTFPIDNLDMTDYTIDTSGNPDAAKLDGFSNQKLYDLYAVISHRGRTINEGHYIAHVRDYKSVDRTQWFECNDRTISKKQVDGRDSSVDRAWFTNADDFTPYVLFYKRKDVAWKSADVLDACVSNGTKAT
ncbi:ubiquitin carboxyl-terminal hydrolase [Xylariales sp. AK1849]|nr:ubiquitin carboxyl-terminal hydrolase [Xylariales sp. AK1849]